MSGKTKADLQAEIESLRKVVAEQSAVLSEGEAKNAPGDADHRLVQIRDAIECLDAGFVLYDSDGTLIFCNQKHRDFYPHVADVYKPGVSREEIMLRHTEVIRAATPAMDIEDYLDERLALINVPRPYTESQLTDGRWVAVHERTVEGGGLVSIRTDITERKKIDRMKSEFISTVSHELRTPLTSIRGSLGLVTGGAVGEVPAQAKDLIEIAGKNCERLINLVNDILDMEKIESDRMEYKFDLVDLNVLIEQTIGANQAYGSEFDVSFVLTETEPDARVRGDGERLSQVLANLLSNAAKFSPPGTEVEVSITRNDGTFRIAVKDNGDGVPEGFRDRIFEKFSQADASDARQGSGTGLGLSISKAIVEKHGGRIDFESEVGEGATFYFDMPAY